MGPGEKITAMVALMAVGYWMVWVLYHLSEINKMTKAALSIAIRTGLGIVEVTNKNEGGD